jgi:putative tributyrin esterase
MGVRRPARRRVVRMALIRCEFFAETLQLSTSMTVVLPEPASGQIGMTGRAGTGPPPVLYLLHGLSDDDSTWLRRTSIERYAAELGLAVVMPAAHRSFYIDQRSGERAANRYWTFVAQELPALVHRFFRVSDRRADTFAAGLSMGGYGALKLALQHPERFAAVASLSGALDLTRREVESAGGSQRFPGLMEQVLGGTSSAGTPDDLFWLLERAEVAGLPELYLCCGTDDALIDENLRFAEAARARGVRLVEDYGPGEHEWGYWDRQIRAVLEWLPPARPKA